MHTVTREAGSTLAERMSNGLGVREPNALGGRGLLDLMRQARTMRLDDRVRACTEFMTVACPTRPLYMRETTSGAGREVTVIDPYTQKSRQMVMFGSNNYLGLAGHRHVRDHVKCMIDRFGVGLAGPPLLNGYTSLHRGLEERLAALKGSESALLFPTGYSANVGLLAGLTQKQDTVVYDELSHASFRDGLRMTAAQATSFPHNSLGGLRRVLASAGGRVAGDVFVGVEGVYSMDGDLAPLAGIARLCRRHGAILVLDDAHGTGTMGATGRGTAEHFDLEGRVDITMGTFSKVFGVTGGFVAASDPIVEYLRFFARSYMFSASLPPVVVAAVTAGLDILESEPDRLARLGANVAYLQTGLRSKGIHVDMDSPILALRVPSSMNLYQTALRFHDAGLFVNAVVFPAVRESEQRFRISLMSEHTRTDLDRLIECIASEWPAGWRNRSESTVSGAIVAPPSAGTGTS